MLKKSLRALALAASALLLSGAASAQLNPYQKGPDPTTSALERNGTFSVRTSEVSRLSALGFGGGRIWYPTASGQYGLIAVSPGFTAPGSSMYFWGERLSTHGFVVIVIDTTTVLDQPEQRASQLMAALNHVTDLGRSRSSPLYGKVDATRRAVAGHSMGGGGALVAAAGNPSLKAAIPMAPWNLASVLRFGGIRVPTMVLACQLDAIAPTAIHASAFYTALPASTPKAYAEMRGDDHLCVMDGGGHYATLGKLGIAWAKRWIDNDRRYDSWIQGAGWNALSTLEVSDKRRGGF